MSVSADLIISMRLKPLVAVGAIEPLRGRGVPGRFMTAILNFKSANDLSGCVRTVGMRHADFRLAGKDPSERQL
jgi:hypothetical protein